MESTPLLVKENITNLKSFHYSLLILTTINLIVNIIILSVFIKSILFLENKLDVLYNIINQINYIFNKININDIKYLVDKFNKNDIEDFFFGIDSCIINDFN